MLSVHCGVLVTVVVYVHSEYTEVMSCMYVRLVCVNKTSLVYDRL